MAKGVRHTVVETPEFRRAADQAGIGAGELAAIAIILLGTRTRVT